MLQDGAEEYGGVQKVCTRNVTSLRRRLSCNTVVTNLEVQNTDFLDAPISTPEILVDADDVDNAVIDMDY